MNRPGYPYQLDGALVRLANAGDAAAFDELVRRYRPGLVLVARRVVGANCLAEDVVQDALALAHRSLASLADADRFGAWLRSIARNRALRARQEAGRLVPADSDSIEGACYNGALDADPARSVLNQADRDSVSAMVAALPYELCAVLTLHYWHLWPMARIAGFLSLPITTVKWRMHRGRRLLQKQLTADQGE